jgi:hypothetical protein
LAILLIAVYFWWLVSLKERNSMSLRELSKRRSSVGVANIYEEL